LSPFLRRVFLGHRLGQIAGGFGKLAEGIRDHATI
jgi:hypothetical protein